MKPTAVQFPQALTVVVSDLARVSSRHGVIAYTLSMLFAAVTLVGSFFYKEITQTFGYQAMGIKLAHVWEGALVVGLFVWLATLVLGLLCVPQGGRTRKLGLSSLGVNLAAGVLVICTML